MQTPLKTPPKTSRRDTDPQQPIRVPAGLAGVVVAETEIGDVRGAEGYYHYRGRDAVELARRHSFEEVADFVLTGALHGKVSADAALRAGRRLPAEVLAALPALATGEPMVALRTGLSLVAQAHGMRPLVDLTEAERHRDALTLIGAVPALIAALHRGEPVELSADGGTAAAYLHAVTGQPPAPAVARAIEQYLSLTIDHGLNNSTFTARVVASAGADLGAVLTAALSALSGPLHGSAPGRALEAIDTIGTPDRAREFVRAELAAGRRIMGFGHAVYRTIDPRSALLEEIAGSLGGPEVATARAIEAEIVAALAELKPGRQLYANVEFYASVVMRAGGLPASLFTPTFAVSRVVSWCAHALEQARGTKIFRPASLYRDATATE